MWILLKDDDKRYLILWLSTFESIKSMQELVSKFQCTKNINTNYSFIIFNLNTS